METAGDNAVAVVAADVADVASDGPGHIVAAEDASVAIANKRMKKPDG